MIKYEKNYIWMLWSISKSSGKWGEMDHIFSSIQYLLKYSHWKCLGKWKKYGLQGYNETGNNPDVFENVMISDILPLPLDVLWVVPKALGELGCPLWNRCVFSPIQTCFKEVCNSLWLWHLLSLCWSTLSLRACIPCFVNSHFNASCHFTLQRLVLKVLFLMT